MMNELLIDTWWYGLTARLKNIHFQSLALKRKAEGFNAIQMVCGIPPEVGAEHPAAEGPTGPAWSLDGSINPDYLNWASKRVKFLNDNGLTVILYGAWGHQMDWVDSAFMKKWWSAIVDTMDDLDVIYCLSGECDLWIGDGSKLLPDLSADELLGFNSPTSTIMQKVKLKWNYHVTLRQEQTKRANAWADVLNHLSTLTQRPLLAHTTDQRDSHSFLPNANKLSAASYQTGHSQESRLSLHKVPMQIRKTHPGISCINLEPWYEGINNSFRTQDQLYALWVSLLSGNNSVCYGTQGVWNAGDGEFLSHWGKQTLRNAVKSPTGALLGKSFAVFNKFTRSNKFHVACEETNDLLISITQSCSSSSISYYPHVNSQIKLRNRTILWSPELGDFVDNLPTSGSVVTIYSFG